MITLTREEAQQVLDALDEYRDSTEDFRVANMCISLIEILRARLSAPKHWSDCAVHSEPAYPAGECDCGLVPVAWADKNDVEREEHDFWVSRQQPTKNGMPLYTAPPQRKEWQGLTDEEIGDVIEQSEITLKNYCSEDKQTEYARAIEAKLKEKNA